MLQLCLPPDNEGKQAGLSMQEVTVVSLLTLALLPEFARDSGDVFLILVLAAFLALAISIAIIVSLAIVFKLTFAIVIDLMLIYISITLGRGLLPELGQDGLQIGCLAGWRDSIARPRLLLGVLTHCR